MNPGGVRPRASLERKGTPAPFIYAICFARKESINIFLRQPKLSIHPCAFLGQQRSTSCTMKKRKISREDVQTHGGWINNFHRHLLLCRTRSVTEDGVPNRKEAEGFQFEPWPHASRFQFVESLFSPSCQDHLIPA